MKNLNEKQQRKLFSKCYLCVILEMQYAFKLKIHQNIFHLNQYDARTWIQF